MLGWFGTEIQFLLAYSEGNSSGVVVQNKWNYFLKLSHLFTYQLIALLAALMAMPGIKTWYDQIVIVRAELDSSRQFQEPEEISRCEEGSKDFGSLVCDEDDEIEARLL